MKNKVKPSILPGFMELIPTEQMLFDDMVRKMTAVYRQNGCMPMDTPLIEKEEILLAKSAGETEKQVYRIDKEKNKQALRFDLTVPFARYVVQYKNDLTFPFKRYQLGKVYRGERNQKGRYREFYQLDVDVINPNKLAINYDAWVMSLAAKAFERIGLTNYVFQINNRKIISGVLGLFEGINTQEVMGLLDKYDKIGREKCYESIQNNIGEACAKVLFALVEQSGTADEVIQAIKDSDVSQMTQQNQPQTQAYTQLKEGIQELEEVIRMLKLMGVKETNFKIDLKIMRGLDYYTGTIFETIIDKNERYGSICSGGRYDNLTGLYTEQQMPGVGISIGMTRLFFVLKEIGFLDTYTMAKEVSYLVSPIGDTLEVCMQIYENLQREGVRSEVYLNQDTLKKQLKYAAAKAIDYVILVGEDEVANGQVVVKNMQTGEQVKVDSEKYIL